MTRQVPLGLNLGPDSFSQGGRFMALVVLSLCQLLHSCSAPESPDVVFDLLGNLPFATRVSDQKTIDFDSPALSESLVAGWSRPRLHAKSGEKIAWSLGDQASIEFTTLAHRDLELQFSCRPAKSPDGASQRLSFSLNGMPIADIDLARRIKTYRVALDRSNLRPGSNLIEIRHAYNQSSEESGASSKLAVAWHAIRFGGAQSAKGDAHSDLASSTLYIPKNLQLEFYFRLSPNSSLQIQKVEGYNGWGGSLSIEVSQDGGEVRSLASLSEPDSSLNFHLDGTPGEPVRLTLRALGSDAENAAHANIDGDGFSIVRPRVVNLRPRPSTLGQAISRQPPRNQKRDATQPNILMYLVDTLRPDHLGCYGYEREISPNIDSFAADGILFEQAIGQSTWTRPAVATLFTGLWPASHGANLGREKLSSDALTLAEVLRDAGYRTAAFISNANVSGTFGFRQGFDEFFQLQGKPKVRSDVMTDRVVGWLESQPSEAPTFLYVHTADPHNPYLAPEQYLQVHAPNSKREIAEITSNPKKQAWELDERVLSSLRDLYDAEIAFNDASFGKLLNYLRRNEMFEDTLIVFVSDHGEEFYEHGAWTHGKNLHAETLNIPLIVRFPDVATGQRIPAPVQQADLFPTILAYLGIEFDPSSLDGRNLLELIGPDSSSESAPSMPIFSYLHLYRDPFFGVVYEGWKLIQRQSGSNNFFTRLYDLRNDPLETSDLAESQPIRVGYLATLIQRKLADTHHQLPSDEAEIDPELEKSLQALGYLQ